jgi:hypothetical protein
LTLGIYTDVELDEQTAAIESLPRLESEDEDEADAA